MTRLQQVFLAVVIAGGLAVAGWIGYQRIMVEQANSTVAVAVDYNDVLRTAALAGRPPQEILAQIKATGVSHVAITELTLSDLVKTRRLFNTASSAVFLAEPNVPPAVRKRIQKQLIGKLPRPEGTTPQGQRYDYYTHLLRIAPQVEEIGVGYDEAVEAVREAGLSIVARPQPKFVQEQDIALAIAAAGDIKADIVVFAGTQVLGYQKQIEQTARALRQSGLKFGYVELAPQAGEQTLAHHLDYKFIRTHSIPQAEMEQISPQRALDRFSLAVSERKTRLCYVRLFFNQGNPVKYNLTYLDQLIERLKRDGFTVGSPQYFNSVPVPDWALSVMFTAIAAALIWLMQSIVGLRRLWFWVITVVALAAAGAAGLSGLAIFRPLAALAAALIFPTWAVIGVRLREHSARHPLPVGLLTFVRVSLLTVVGGVLVAACLTSDAYLMKIAQFRGVKLSQLLPLLVIGVVFAARSMHSYWEVRTELGQAQPELPALAAGLRQAFSQVVRYWHVAAVVVGLGVLAVLMMRSGNQPAVGASGIEVQLRALLDRLLVVRPRSKEIFFAHPIMLFTLILVAAGLRRGVWAGLAAGAIGQVSILNTFCHLHTPLMVSLIRVGHGLWLGVLGGLVLWLAIYLLGVRRSRRAPDRASPKIT